MVCLADERFTMIRQKGYHWRKQELSSSAQFVGILKFKRSRLRINVFYLTIKPVYIERGTISQQAIDKGPVAEALPCRLSTIACKTVDGITGFKGRQFGINVYKSQVIVFTLQCAWGRAEPRHDQYPCSCSRTNRSKPYTHCRPSRLRRPPDYHWRSSLNPVMKGWFREAGGRDGKVRYAPGNIPDGNDIFAGHLFTAND